jgi:hypothetical protein
MTRRPGHRIHLSEDVHEYCRDNDWEMAEVFVDGESRRKRQTVPNSFGCCSTARRIKGGCNSWSSPTCRDFPETRPIIIRSAPYSPRRKLCSGRSASESRNPPTGDSSKPFWRASISSKTTSRPNGRSRACAKLFAVADMSGTRHWIPQHAGQEGAEPRTRPRFRPPHPASVPRDRVGPQHGA